MLCHRKWREAEQIHRINAPQRTTGSAKMGRLRLIVAAPRHVQRRPRGVWHVSPPRQQNIPFMHDQIAA